MSIVSELDGALGAMLDVVGEPITIYPAVGDSVTLNAVVTGGSFDRIGVAGGFYDEIRFVAAVRKSDLGGFMPLPGMLVDGRGYELRIETAGVDFFRAHYRLNLISRDAQ